MHTFAPALAVVAALMWPAAASAQSLAEIAQREAARRKAEANAPKTPPAAAPQTKTDAPAKADAPAKTNAPATTDAPAEQTSSPTGAMSLADVARREAARRKAVEASGQHGRALTTGDVMKWQPPADTDPAKSTAAATDAKKGEDAKGADAGRPTDGQTAPGDEAKGEVYWHNRMSAAREDLRRNQSFAEALQSRINALSAEFAAKDDPNQRAQIADDRQKALAELDRLTSDIEKSKKSISEVEDDARRAGVPAGWIR